MKSFQDGIKYSTIARENSIEGKLVFLYINNGFDNSELILKNQELDSKNKHIDIKKYPFIYFEKVIRDAFYKTNKNYI